MVLRSVRLEIGLDLMRAPLTPPLRRHPCEPPFPIEGPQSRAPVANVLGRAELICKEAHRTPAFFSIFSAASHASQSLLPSAD